MSFFQFESEDLSTTVPKHEKAIAYRVTLTYRGPIQVVKDKEIKKEITPRDIPVESALSSSSLDEKGEINNCR